MSGDRPQRRAGRRPGRRGGKMDERAKLERSRLSARECRARKKLRYQYLEDLVANREKAIFALRDELELYKQWCIQVDEGLLPLALLKLVQDDSDKDPDVQGLLSDVVVVSDDSSDSQDGEDEDTEADPEDAGASYNRGVVSHDQQAVLDTKRAIGSVTFTGRMQHVTAPDNGSSHTAAGVNKVQSYPAVSGATGSASDMLIPPGGRDFLMNLGSMKFGTLDENLDGVDKKKDDLIVFENAFQQEGGGSEEDSRDTRIRIVKSLPTILEENEG